MRQALLILLLGTVCASSLADNRLARLPKADDVFYHFMPIAWRNGTPDPDNFGDFQGMTDSLDYLTGLGITAVWMNPVFDSRAYHGYQHGKGNVLNPRFGTEADFTKFLLSANAAGVEVYLDFVTYGISRDVNWFNAAFGNPGSTYDDWFAFTNGSNTSFLGSTFPTWNGDTVQHIHWDLRTEGPRSRVIRWAEKWLDPDEDGDFSDGVSGYRLDHVWEFYSSGPDGWGYNLGDFWTEWHNALRTLNPDVFTFAEQANWGSYGGEFLDVFDGAMTKPFEFAARDAIRSGNASALYSSMEATLAALPANGTFVAIIGDHDIDRLASNIGADTPQTIDKGKAAAAVLLLQPFPPIIYYGDEIGMIGVKGNYGGDQNDIPMREPFKWNATFGPPMSRYHFLNSAAFQARYARNNDGRSVAEQEGQSGSLLETYRKLIQLRHDHVAVRRGTYLSLPSTSSSVWAFHRRYEQGDAPLPDATETLLVAINLSGQTVTTQLDLRAVRPDGPTPAIDALTEQPLANVTASNAASYAVTIPPYGYRLIASDLPLPAPTPEQIDGRALDEAFTIQDEVAVQVADEQPGANLRSLSLGYDEDGLRVGIAGELPNDATAIALWIDTKQGGQTQLDLSDYSAPPAGMPELDGTIFDAGFQPDRMLYLNLVNNTLYADDFQLRVDETNKTYLGSVGRNAGSGVLLGGTNPLGIEVALANDGTATGLEVLLTWDALQRTPRYCGDVRVLAAIVTPGGVVTEQVLPSVAELPGIAPDFSQLAGLQYATAPLVSEADLNGDGRTNWDDYFRFLDHPSYVDGDRLLTQADEDCVLGYLRRGPRTSGVQIPCLAGPDNFLGDDCGGVDLDADFDVDLGDVLILQQLGS